jgi:hypothetical protein
MRLWLKTVRPACPQTVCLGTEPLPLSRAGKVLKTVLRKELKT